MAACTPAADLLRQVEIQVAQLADRDAHVQAHVFGCLAGVFARLLLHITGLFSRLLSHLARLLGVNAAEVAIVILIFQIDRPWRRRRHRRGGRRRRARAPRGELASPLEGTASRRPASAGLERSLEPASPRGLPVLAERAARILRRERGARRDARRET